DVELENKYTDDRDNWKEKLEKEAGVVIPVSKESDELEEEEAAEEETEEQDKAMPLELEKPVSKPTKPLVIEEPAFTVEEVKQEEKVVEKQQLYDPTLDLSSYKFPPVDLLNEFDTGKVQVTKEELEENKDRIVATLQNFKIGIQSIKATIGPTVTLYEIVPDAGIKISRIKNLEDDIALSLAALGIRIIAPIPGRGTIGIEVPNKNREMVGVRSVLTTDKFMNSDKELPVVLGKTISNEVYVVDLTKMPHLLVAGATGQGKSVGLNILLTSLLYKKHPSQLKFVLVDPKKVEMSLYSKLERHFLAKLPNSEEAIITDTRKVVHTLNSLCIEMENRYEMLKDAGAKNLKEYNTKFIARKLNPKEGHRFLPYIVVVIDELADLMMTAGKEVETPIARLAQLARAIGIHLVVATQRPSVNVITGVIKANFPARISFRVTSKVDSRTILDAGGADQLIGMGDMLLSAGSEVLHLQCPFVDTSEVENVCDYIAEQRGYDFAY
ncbi:MAG TPA: DNA translocase FtsK, partial [Cyclobacteriaceae bacterium]|nr:DNA translocase FtsK [Cyclobacteriaceae bacterium]